MSVIPLVSLLVVGPILLLLNLIKLGTNNSSELLNLHCVRGKPTDIVGSRLVAGVTQTMWRIVERVLKAEDLSLFIHLFEEVEDLGVLLEISLLRDELTLHDSLIKLILLLEFVELCYFPA